MSDNAERSSGIREHVEELGDKMSQRWQQWRRSKLVLANIVVPGHPILVDRDGAEVAHPKPLPEEFAGVAHQRLEEIARLRDRGVGEISEAGFRERWDIARKIAGDGSLAVMNLARLLFPSQHERMGLRKALYDLSEHNSDHNVKKHLKRKFPFMVRARSEDGRGTTFQDSASLEECLLDDEKFNKVLETESGQAMLYALLELLIDSKENAVVAGVAEAMSGARAKLKDGITKEHLMDYGKWRRWFEKTYTGISIPAITGGTTMILSTLGVRNPALLAILATTGASAIALGWFMFVSEIRRRALEGDTTIREALGEMANGTGDEESGHWMDILQRNHLIRAFLIAVCIGEAGSNMIGGGNTTGVAVNATNTAVQGLRVTGAQGDLIGKVEGNVATMERELGEGWKGNAEKEAEGTGVSGRAGKKSVYNETVAKGDEVMRATEQAKERLRDPVTQAKWERFRNQFGTAVTTVTAALFGNESITQAASDRLMSVEHSQRLYEIYRQQEAQVRQTNEAANQAVIGKSQEKYGSANPEVLAKVSEVNVSFTKPEQHHRSTLRILSELFGPMFGWIAFLALWAISNRLEMSTLLLTRKNPGDRERGEEALNEFATTHGKDIDELTLEERTNAVMKKDKKKKKKKTLKKNSHAHVQLIQAPAAEELVEVTDTAVKLFATKLCELQEHANLAAVLPGVKLYDPEEMEGIINAQIDYIAFPHGGRFATWFRKTFGDTSVGYQPLEHAQARYAVFQKIMDDPELRGEFVTKALFHTDRLRAAKRANDLEGMLRAMQNDWERRTGTGTSFGPNGTRMSYQPGSAPEVTVPTERSGEEDDDKSEEATEEDRNELAEALRDLDRRIQEWLKRNPNHQNVSDMRELQAAVGRGLAALPQVELADLDLSDWDEALGRLEEEFKTLAEDGEKVDQSGEEQAPLSVDDIKVLRTHFAILREIAKTKEKPSSLSDEAVWESYDAIQNVMDNDVHAKQFAAAVGKKGLQPAQVIDSIKHVLEIVATVYKSNEEEAPRQYTQEDLSDLITRVNQHQDARNAGTLSGNAVQLLIEAQGIIRKLSAASDYNKQQRLVGQLEQTVESLEAAAQKQPNEPEPPEKKVDLSDSDRAFIAEFEQDAARVRQANPGNGDILAIVDGLDALVRVWKAEGGKARRGAVTAAMKRDKWQDILDGAEPAEGHGGQQAARRATVRTDLGDGDMEIKKAELRKDAEAFAQFTRDHVAELTLPSGQPNFFPGQVKSRVLNKIDADFDAAQKAFDELVRSLKESYKLTWTRS